MEDFKQHRISPSLFQIEDVEGDNACFYRSVANCLGLRTKYDDTGDIIASFDFTELRPGGISGFYEHPEWGYNGDSQDSLARNLQEMSYQWVQQHRSKKITWDLPPVELSPMLSNPETPDEVPTEASDLTLTVETLINLTHDIDYEEYLENYQHFAGDCVITDTDELIADRWGGFVEQIALSHIFKIPIVVLVAQSYDTRTHKIITGRIANNKAYRGVMLKPFQITGREYSQVSPIYLLWKKTKTGPHYMALYPNDQEEAQRVIQQQLTK